VRVSSVLELVRLRGEGQDTARVGKRLLAWLTEAPKYGGKQNLGAAFQAPPATQLPLISYVCPAEVWPLVCSR